MLRGIVCMALLGLLGLAGAAHAQGLPQFATYSAQGVNNENNAGEPSIGVNPKTGAVLFQSYTSTLRVQFKDTVRPENTEWEDAESPGGLNLDPILFTSRGTGRTWGGGLEGPCGNLAFTDTDAAPWTKSTPCTGVVDHETIGSGPWHGDPGSVGYPEGVYYCAQAKSDTCTTSRDGGATWDPPIPITGTCTGFHGHVKVGPDGVAYLPMRDCAQTVGGAISSDNGQTWLTYSTGQPTPDHGFDPSVGVTSDNVVYEAWNQAGDYHPVVARSTDHGAHWDKVVDLAKTVDPPLNTSTFHSVVAGDAGRVAVSYLATQGGPPPDTGPAATNNPFKSTDFTAAWYLWVSFTYDGGQTWSTVRASDDPVQRGCISDGGTVSTACRNLLDFEDAQLQRDGRVVVAYADGCLDDCALPTGTAADSQSAHATIARQIAGKSLLAAADGLPAPGSGALTPAPAVPNGGRKPNHSPKACFKFKLSKRRLRVDGRCSRDAEGRIVSYRWAWGDQERRGEHPGTDDDAEKPAYGHGRIARHRYKRRGRYQVTLIVMDKAGATRRVTHRVRVR